MLPLPSTAIAPRGSKTNWSLSSAKAVEIGPEVWRDRLGEERGVQPLKIARDAILMLLSRPASAKTLELAYVHPAATSLHAVGGNN
jgi:hypothetical protein